MMTPKPRSVFTKGVRTLVPRLTHALTLPVSDVFGLNHYALSLGGEGDLAARFFADDAAALTADLPAGSVVGDPGGFRCGFWT